LSNLEANIRPKCNRKEAICSVPICIARATGSSDFSKSSSCVGASLVKERIPRRFGFDPMRDIQVLCPMNHGGLGARSLNIALQRALNPRGDPKVEKFGMTFAIGDKVMQIENDYDKEVYNGNIGFVGAIDSNSAR